MKRTLLLLLIFILVGWVFVRPAHAQTFNPAPGAEEFGAILDNKIPNGQMSKEVYTVNTQASYLNTATCLIVGCSQNPLSAFNYRKSAVAMIGNAMSTMYAYPPADLALWVQDTGQTLGFMPKQAYAQGIGFSGLSPLLPVWKAFRNIAYLLLALGLIIIGFMVMFRKKIDPKTVVTVQNSLPRVVITLILITFSYAIIGFMIDLMYLFVAFINIILRTGFSGFSGINDLIFNFTNGGGFMTLIGAVFQPVANINPLARIGNDLLTGQMGAALADFLKGALFTASGIGPLFQAILSLAFLFAFIRILLMLLNSYVQILLAVITGPLQILIDVLPGSNGFSSWIKNIFINVITFPITIFMLMLGNVLYQNTSGGNLWVPPLLPQPLGQVGSQTIGGVGGLALSLISLGIILVIPNIVNGIKEALKSKPIIPAGPGAIFSPVAGAVQTTMGTASQFYYGSEMIKRVGDALNKNKK